MYVFTFLINCCNFVVEGAKFEIEATRIFVVENNFIFVLLNTNVVGLEFARIFGCCKHSFIMFNINVVGFESTFTSTFSSISRLLVNKMPMALASMVCNWNQR